MPHNKLSFEALFEWLEKDYPNHKYVAIFGSTGDKAVNRRLELGVAAGQHADRVYLSSDDVGYEPFDSINADIIPHLDHYGVPWTADPLRENCIRDAFAQAIELYRETVSRQWFWLWVRAMRVLFIRTACTSRLIATSR